MRVWRKQRGRGPAARGVARAAVAGVARQELVKEAVQILLAGGNVDRAGVWIESSDRAGLDFRGFAEFRGVVSDVNGEETPAEWARLSDEAPLPHELLTGGKTVEQDLDDSPEQPVIGALVEMRRALWVPVENRGHLRGMLFAGTRKKQAAPQRMLLESVAAELGLAMELEDERRLARERHADLGAVRRILAALGNSQPTDTILANLAESCTETGTNGSGTGGGVRRHRPSTPEDGNSRRQFEPAPRGSRRGRFHNPRRASGE